MRTMHTLTSALLLSLSLAAPAGPTTPPPGPIEPTGPTVGQLAQMAEDVLQSMQGQPGAPVGDLSLWIQGFPGQQANGRIALSGFSYTLVTPDGAQPSSACSLSSSVEPDPVFVPLALASVMGTHIPLVQVDQCMQLGQQLVCPLTIKLVDVQFTDISTFGSEGVPAGPFTASLVAAEITVIYRVFRTDGTVQTTYQTTYDFTGGRP